jgi:hypothetical protein
MLDLVFGFFDKVKSTIERRNVEYGNSWYGKTGAIAPFCKLETKYNRLYYNVFVPLTSGQKIVNIEAALDSCIDLAAYAAFLYVIIEKDHKTQTGE